MINLKTKSETTKNKNLVSSELQYRRVFETAQDGILLLDFQTGMILDVNKFLIDLLGYSKSDFLEKHVWEVGAFKDIAASKKNFKTLQEKDYVRFEDLPLETKSGKKIEVEFVANAYFEGTRKIIQCNIRDITDRVTAERKLHLSEERYSVTLEALEDGLWDWNVTTGSAFFSPTYYKMLGYKDGEFTASYDSWRKLVHSEDITRVEHDLQKSIKTGKGFSIDLRMQKKGGDWLWVSTRGKTIEQDKKGKPTRMVGTLVDITKRLQSEYLTTVSELKYRRLFETAKDGILLVDFNTGMILDVNKFLIDMLGYSKADFLQKHLWEVGVLKNIIASKNKFLTLKENDYVRYEDLPLETKDRKKLDVEFVSNVYQVDGVKVIQCNIRDITVRREAELNADIERIFSRTVIDSIPGTFYVLDKAGKYVRWNSYQRDKIVGKPENEVVKTNALDTIHPHDRALIQSRIASVLIDGKVESVEGRVLLRGGPEYVWLLMTGQRMIAKGEPFLVGIGIDITEKKKIEEELKSSRTQLIEMTSHLSGVVYQFYAKTNGEMGFYYVSSRSKAVLGLEPKLDGYFARFSELVLPSYRDGFIESIKKAVKESSEWFYEGIIRKPTGEEVWFNGNAFPTFRDGETIFNGIVTDITERKNSEKKLLDSENKYKSLFDNMLNGFALHRIITDKNNMPVDYEYIEINAAFEKMLNIKKETVVGKTVTKVIPNIKKDPANWIGRYGKIALEGTEETFDEYSDALDKWFSVYAYSPMKGYFATIFIDITEKKLSEDKLRTSEDKFSKAFQISSYARVVTLVETGAFIDVNPAFTTITGYSSEEALASSSVAMHLWLNPKDRDDVLADLRLGKMVSNREYQFRKKNGDIITGLFSAQVIQLRQGMCVFSSISDITDRKNMEREIARGKAEAEAILASIGDAVFACDKNGTIVLFNRVAVDMSGIPAEKAIGKHYSEVVKFVREVDGSPSNDFIAEAITSNKITKMANHVLLLREDGVTIPVADSAAPITDLTGNLLGCVVVFHDVTKETYIDKAKTEFVSIASHQLRTPLTAIKWYTEMLLAEGVDRFTAKQHTYTQEIYKASQRMTGLVDSLLNVSRLELGTLVMIPKQVDIFHIADDVLNDLKPQLLEKELVVTRKYDKDISLITADPKFLTIIFQNILTNSVKYSNLHGKIDLKITKNKEDILIVISDTGIGIPHSQQKSIFGKMFRADNARKIEPDGSGLGLYIVSESVRTMGGKLWFESTEGKGTTFYVSLPLIKSK